MGKHILDRPQIASRNWLGRAVAIERAEHPDPTSLSLQRRKRHIRRSARSLHYLRFARRQDV
ncbi:hypothetical protein [Yoonia sp. BS5-3]|uniref:Uncharacterized protein n=1 Tax=Yoonia phaeophyticola TaxID=3137369 RepID=A0ABZ2V746_9RHOB